MFARTHRLGDLVNGHVTNVVPFGAFVRLEGDVDGLIHISELSDNRVDDPNDVVKKGQQVLVKIIQVDEERQRVSLSLRQAATTVERAAANE